MPKETSNVMALVEPILVIDVLEIFFLRIHFKCKYIHIAAKIIAKFFMFCFKVTPGIRGLLVTWMTQIHHQLTLCQDTLFIAVNIVDRVLDVMQTSRDYLQLLGVTAILLASKLVSQTQCYSTYLLSIPFMS